MEAKYIAGSLSGLITVSFILPWIHSPFGGTVSPIMMLDLMNRSSGFFPGQPAPSMPLGLLIFLFSFVLAGIATLAAFFAEEFPQALAAAAGLLPIVIILYFLVVINGQRGGPTFFSQMSGQLMIGAWAYGIASAVLTGVAFLHPEMNGTAPAKSAGGVSSVIGGRRDQVVDNRDGRVFKVYQGQDIRVAGTWFRVGHRKFQTVEAAQEHIDELVTAAKAAEAAEAAAKEEAPDAPPSAEGKATLLSYKGRVIQAGERRYVCGSVSAATEEAIHRYIDRMETWSSKTNGVSVEEIESRRAEIDAWAKGLSEKRDGLPDGGLVTAWRDFPITRGADGFVANEISFPSAQEARAYIDAMLDG